MVNFEIWNSIEKTIHKNSVFVSLSSSERREAIIFLSNFKKEKEKYIVATTSSPADILRNSVNDADGIQAARMNSTKSESKHSVLWSIALVCLGISVGVVIVLITYSLRCEILGVKTSRADGQGQSDSTDFAYARFDSNSDATTDVIQSIKTKVYQ